MFTIYHKNFEEINRDIDNDAKNFSPTYVKWSNDECIDTNKLTDEQIIALIEEDYTDWLNPSGNYQMKKITKLSSTLELSTTFGPNFQPSYDLVIGIISILAKADFNIFYSVIKAFKCLEKIHKGETIARFLKDEMKDYSEINLEELISALNILKQHDIEREKNLKLFQLKK